MLSEGLGVGGGVERLRGWLGWSGLDLGGWGGCGLDGVDGDAGVCWVV